MKQTNLNPQQRGLSQDAGQRIDLNNYQPDKSKKNELKRRLYDSGISNIPMPSVKRPIEENISSRPFSARMNSNKIQSLSPLKKKIQDLNTNLIKNMNESYQEAALIEAKYQGEGTADYYRSQHVVIPSGGGNQQQISNMNARLSLGQQQRFGGSMRAGGPGDLFANRQLLLAKTQKPPKDIPPLDPDVRNRINQSLNQSQIEYSKMFQGQGQGPSAMIYQGFEGGVSISQKNLEQARSKFLLDKLTGKLPQEMRAGIGYQLPPINKDSPRNKKGSKSKGSHLSQSSKSRVDEQDYKQTMKAGFGAEPKKEALGSGKQQPQKWSDLDKYIELLLDSKSEEETVFVYLNPNPNADPYDLLVCSYQLRNEAKYYTLSGKGLTLYENDTPIEFLSLGQWLIERDSYNHIKELPFFKKFKRWKFMRMWKKTIKHQNRMKAQNSLEEKLFMLQDHFCSHLTKHRQYMLDMEKLRFVDLCRNADTKTIEEFAQVQQDRRKMIGEEISKFSDRARDNVRECITKVLSELRERIVSEIALDEERKKNNPIQSSNTIAMKKKETDNAFEKLGFPEGMTYGHRSSLRKECSRFLRFAYLVDFLSLEALANIYIGSVREMVIRLQNLDETCDMEKVMSMEFDEANRQPGPPSRGKEPLFYVAVQLTDRKDIPANEILSIECDDFRLPPQGTSQDKDFDVLCHLELEPEVEEGKKDDDDDEGEEDKVEEAPQKYKLTIPRIQNYWLRMMPNEEAFIEEVVRSFEAGLDQIQVFERWGKHNELLPYFDVLEDWDDVVGDQWDEPDSVKLNPFTWINENEYYTDKKEKVMASIESAFEKAKEFLTRFQPLLEIYWRNKQVDLNILVHERLRNPVESLSHTVKLFNYYHSIFNSNLPSQTDLGMLQLDSKGCRTKLLPTPKEFLAKIEELVPKVIKLRSDEAKKWLAKSLRDLQKSVATVEDFVEQNNNLNYANENFQGIRDKVDLYGQYYNCLAEYSLKVKKEDKDNFTECVQLISQLTSVISNVESQQDSNMETFKRTLNELIPQLNQQIDSLNEEATNPIYLSGDANMFEVLKNLDDIESRFKVIEQTSVKYNQWQEVLQTQPTVFDTLDVLREGLSLRAIMWRSLKEWEELTEKWTQTQFNAINAKDIATRADQYAKICLRLEKNLEENPIQVKLKELVDTFKGAMPIVVALRNEHLKEHHWKEIKDLIQADFDISNPDFTLQSLIDLNAVQYQEDITAISTQASQEASLRGQLQGLDEQWKKIDFVAQQYKDKDAMILMEIDDIFQALDEGLATINMVLGSRYVKPLRIEAETWKKNLFTLNQIVEEWVITQKQWMYLENIFLAPDIKKQLPTESQKFEQVDKFFKQLMNKVHKTPNALRTVKTNANLLDQLKLNNDILDEIQKKLEDYLENKRVAFPRFYFLSNDELLEILANSQNLDVIQMHLKTCFDNVVRIEVADGIDIQAMMSNEGERVPFSKSQKIRGLVEQWLDAIQVGMRDTLWRLLKQGLTDYGTTERKAWVLTHFGQVVATIAQIMWCSQTEMYINEMSSNPFSLQEWFDLNEAQLAQLTELVRGKLTSLQRKIIVALVTTDVHARDIVEGLVKENVQSPYDFAWQQQLRYYWEEDADDCRVKQINASLKYGYEYMGATSRLVITPLTDRCWITITGALHIKLGANPSGPAGTGKTESTKDLAKALGMLCIVFNCSDQVDYKMIGRLFSGLAQQGAWTCLDEFNRIDIEVLSVIAQQLLTIREALLRQAPHFLFEGKEILLTPSCGVHVTMNPGYAGRTELPDNLKVLFRPVAMMIPDYGLIAEIMLYAEGFGNAKILSKKMVQLYKLSSEQLSQQDHYDFGMRAVKSVLVMAGSLKRANPNLNEDAVLIRAMRDSNVPKFLKDDLPLFSAIVQDLFPSVEITESDQGELLTQIQDTIDHFSLQQHPIFTLKVIQLFETFNVRFGVMLVGPTGGGKTTCYKVLQHTITQLKERGSKDERYQIVKKSVLNPKSISMGELYGEVNPLSQEWHDGLASKIMRAAAQETSQENTWVVFDGPVDALWIENMNTVLDDNMTLCLANGQRIKLRAQMRILFEVQDLAVASPATVSRCGMVYLTPDELGWRPYVKTWVHTFFTEDTGILTPDLKDHLYSLFDASIDLGLEKMRDHFSEPVLTVNLQQVISICNFLEILVNPTQGFKGTDEEKRKLLNSIFAWCYTWGMGASLDERSKERFDDIVRDCFKNVQIPPNFTVFDYFFDLKKDKSFKPWTMKVPAFVYDKDIPYFELLVPTTDTYKFSFCLELLLSKEKNAFFTGMTGVGKSVVIQNTLQRLQDEKDIVPVFVNFSAQTTSTRTQQSIEDKLEKKKRTLFGAQPGKKIAIFIDDINMPATEQYGAQPPIELLRLFIDKRGLYDREEWMWKDVEDTTLIACAAPPGGGRSPITLRFTRHFNMFCLPSADRATLTKIFGSILAGFLKVGFQEPIQKMDENLVSSTIEIYQRISEELRATPAKFHYLFNLRDVSKVFQGVLMVKPVSIQSPETFAKLWINESLRVFYDRLINDEDKQWFTTLIMELLNRNFRMNFEHDEIFVNEKIMFGDLLKLDAPVKLYEEIKDKTKLMKVLNGMIDDYNIGNSNKMNLVFFDDAIEHILRIARVLRQPRGNIMLIGVGGSGKQSLTRLSSHMLEMVFKQIEITKNFGPTQFKDFLKELMFTTGIEGRTISFAMTDTQIISESFLEDINNLLNTGEVPNLMLPEDRDKIINGVRPIVIEMKKIDSIDVINQTFVSRVRNNLHIALCMSPVGDTLRVRCRKFPSLVNCCTLDWFSRWPEQALLYVSSTFLKELELPSDDVRKSLAEMCMVIHTTVEEEAENFYGELRRRVYTTPKSYLDLISLYLNTLDNKRYEYNINRNRLATGLKKLNDTNKSIAELKIKLAELQPQLQKKNEDLKVALDRVNIDKKIANEKERVVSQEAEIVNKKAVEAKAISDDAEADLNAAKPELEASEAALKNLDKAAIVEIKTFPNPPAAVVMVMEAVMILLQEKTDWNNVRAVLGDTGGFINKLLTYNVQNTPESVLAKVRKNYLSKKEFDPEDVGKKSAAAKCLCIWCVSVSKFQIVVKKVEPKKKKFEEVQHVLQKAQSELNQKMSEVNKVKEAVAKLEAECQRMQDEKERLESDMDRCEKRMGRAEKLVVLLVDEGVRWKETVGTLQVEIEQLVGNVFLSCACISYFGAFTGIYRKKLVDKWVQRCLDKGIPTSEDFSVIKIMGDPVIVRGWNIASLPTDQVSIENGILATKAQRWALCIDPQQQANKWIKNMERNNNLLMMKFGQNNFLREVSGAVRNGRPCLVEDLEEYIDPAIDPILLKQAFKTEGGLRQMRLGDATLDYDENFRFFMTTKMPNPHYLPEVCIKVTLINFTVTFSGLEEQLLGDVVIQEKPEIERKRDEIVVTMDADQRTLKNIEIMILKLLSESTEEQILDEDNLINVLENSKKTSKEINERMAQSLVVEEEINKTRNQYRTVAVRGSILYFVIADLAGIDPMYQYSLGYVKRLFNSAIEKSKKSKNLEERLSILIDNISKIIYTNVSRGLFEAHKIIYSFLITTSINRNNQNIKESHWNILLRGPGVLTAEQLRNKPKNPDAKLITVLSWELLYFTDANEAERFGGLCESILKNNDEWTHWATCQDPHTEKLPLFWEEKLTNFERLILLKAFRPEKLLFAFQNYVIQEQGRFYVESPSVTMEVVYNDTDVKTPLIFVLSQGADPTSSLIKFAKERGFSEKLNVISLGQGQGPKAEALIKASKKNGEWVMLQNCHLAKSWMPNLESQVINFAGEEAEIHLDFRLYLTSMPADYFPVSVLQNGVKLTTEPPRGLKANMKRNYQEISETQLNDCKKPEIWKKLLFGLCFFHAIIQERRKFGPLGWNIRYEFNDSDLDTSMTMLKIFLDEQEDIPWDALLYVTGHINYGGRVTDDWDRRCLLSLLKIYYNIDILEDGLKFSQSGIYYAPTNGNIEVYREYIDTLPMIDNPEVFGLHENANITFQNQESEKIVSTILSIQPRIGGSAGGKTPDEIVLERAKELKKQLPGLLEKANAKKDTFKADKSGLISSLSTVLLQEMQRFNKLLTVMRSSLVQLKKAIKGFIVMSQELDSMYLSIQNGQVPKNWEKVAYPSLKPLVSWYKDLLVRVAFMQDWLQNGQPNSFWISGFFFPQGFMTGCLQTHARQYRIAIDKLSFAFQILNEEEPGEVEEAPEDGVYIYGLFMDGARWDREHMIIADQFPSEMYNKMPLIWFKPIEDYKPDPEEYSCPIYKTSVRAGMLSTTGQSTNFIVAVELQTREAPRVWTLRAAAMLCQLND